MPDLAANVLSCGARERGDVAFVALVLPGVVTAVAALILARVLG